MYEAMKITHFIGLAMGVGTSFAFMFIGIAASKMPPEEGSKFYKNALAISKMGHIGLTLLVLSGLYLIRNLWGTIGDSPLLLTKLILVVVLGGLIGMISSRAKKAVKENDDAKLQSLAPFGKLALLTGLAIIVLAVLQFG